MVPALTLSLSSSAVVGVVRMSVGMGRTRGWVPPSSLSSVALDYDSFCLACALWLTMIFTILSHLILPTMAEGKCVLTSLDRKETHPRGFKRLSYGRVRAQTKVLSASYI